MQGRLGIDFCLKAILFTCILSQILRGQNGLAKDETVRTLKPVAELSAPKGLANPTAEVKLPKGMWTGYQRSFIGDFTEMTGDETVLRQEIYDIADHGVTILSKQSITIKGKVQVSENATKMIFTEEERPEPKGKDTVGAVTKDSDRKFKVGDEEITADQLTESVVNGEVAYRSWTSKKLPAGAVLLTEDSRGKCIVRLTAYGRGK